MPNCPSGRGMILRRRCRHCLAPAMHWRIGRLGSRFQPFAIGTALRTGYYEPELRGAEYPVSPYLVPLYTLPPSLPDGQPLPDRAAIEAGALEGRGLELAWVDDPVEAFFLHIQ